MSPTCGVDLGHGDRQDERVRLVVAEEVGGDPVGHPQGPAEERAVGVLDDHEPAVHQGPGRPQPGPAAAGRLQRAAELEGEADAGPPAGDVVVQIPVQALEPGVEIGAIATSRISVSSGVRPNERTRRRRRRSDPPAWPRRHPLRRWTAAQRRQQLAGPGSSTVPGSSPVPGSSRCRAGLAVAVGVGAPRAAREQRQPGAGQRLSTSESGAYRPRKRSPGSGSSLRLRATRP